MNKIITRALLAVAIVFMAYMCYSSLQKPIEFEAQKEIRKEAVVKRLINIRTAEVEYKDQNGKYTDNFDTLIAFIKTAEKPVIKKEGRITDMQLSKGLTEKKALEIIKSDNAADAEKYGIEDFETFKNEFKRDTIYEKVLVAAFGENFAIDSIRFVPFTSGKQFELETGVFVNKSEVEMSLFEARTPNDVYLNGLNRQLIVNMNEEAKALDKYAGLKVGDVVAPNNNTGNWE